MWIFPECSTVIRGAPRRSQVCRCAPRRSAMQRDPSPGRQAACNSLSEGTRFRQSRQSLPEHPGVSDGNQGCCWCNAHVDVQRRLPKRNELCSQCSILITTGCKIYYTVDVEALHKTQGALAHRDLLVKLPWKNLCVKCWRIRYDITWCNACLQLMTTNEYK